MPALQKADTEWNSAIHSPRHSPKSRQNTGAMTAAPSSSMMSVVRMMNPVRRTMPLIFGAATASLPWCLRWNRPIRRPENMANAAATVITPMPPIWISKQDDRVAKARPVRRRIVDHQPVTHTEVVAVNSASINGVKVPAADETGSVSRSAPSRITPANPSTMI